MNVVVHHYFTFAPDRITIVVDLDLLTDKDKELKDAIIGGMENKTKNFFIENFSFPYHAQVNKFPCEVHDVITLYTE